jgi:sec-independent protein translocase protein TatA
MFGIGHWELLVIGIVAILLFGKRLPTVCRSFGQSLMELKRGFLEVQQECDEIEKGLKTDAKT